MHLVHVEHFDRTSMRNDDGRFLAVVPFKSCGHTIVSSEAIAMRRFLYLENKLNNDMSPKERYSAFFQELFDLELSEKVPDDQLDNSRNLYLRHQCVTKKDLYNKISCCL